MSKSPVQPQSNPEVAAPQRCNLLHALSAVSGMTMLSRVSGLARDIVIAVTFGADAKTDAFFVAFKIPNFFRRLFAEGSFSQAFVPVFTEYKEQRGLNAVRDLASHVAGALGLCLLLLTSFMAMAAPLVILLFGPGFEPERHELAAQMLRYTAFYLLFISLVALSAGIQNSYQRFKAAAFTPVLLNLCLIVAALWLPAYLDTPIMALAIGVFIAGLVQFLFQIPFLRRLNMLPLPRFNWRHSGMCKVLKLMLPAMLSSSVVQISLVLDTIIASFLVAGSVTWLYYSDRMVELPLGVFSIAIATVLLPSLSKRFTQQDNAGFSRNLDWGMRLSTIITVPAAIGLVLLAKPILITLVQYGRFDTYAATMAGYSLIAYAIGLPAFGYVKILSPGFFARQDTRTPLRITIYAIFIKLALTLLFVLPLYLQDIAWAHVGLALATSLTAWVQTVLLYYYLRRRQAYSVGHGWWSLLLQIGLAALVMTMGLIYFTPGFEAWVSYTMWRRLAVLSALIVPAVMVFFALLRLTGVRWQDYRAVH